MSEILANEALSLRRAADLWTPIKDDQDYRLMGEFIINCRLLMAKICEAHKPSITAAHQAHKAAIALRDSHLEPITAALDIVEPLALAYKAEQDRLAREKAAHALQLKEAQALKDAEALEALGFAEDADTVIAQATAPTRITPQISTLPKIQGLSTRKRWTFRYIDRRAVKREFCIPSEGIIKIHVDQAFYKVSQVTPEMVRELEDEVGGIEVFEQETMVGRTK